MLGQIRARIIPVVTGIAITVDGEDRYFSRHVDERQGIVNGASRFPAPIPCDERSEEHTSEPQSLMRISYAVFCLKKKKQPHTNIHTTSTAEYSTNTQPENRQQDTSIHVHNTRK